MKKIIFILTASMIVLTGCNAEDVVSSSSSGGTTPVNGYVTPKGINAVPSQ